MSVLLKLTRKPAAILAVDERAARLIWRAAALLLDYPTEQTRGLLDDLAAVTVELPAPAGPALRRTVEHLRRTPLPELAADYVETFDLRRRNSLHLSYYAHGDTRARGMALLRFKHAYRTAGAVFDGETESGELPDHLAVVLEFAATVDPVSGARLLGEHVPVLELLRLSLSDNGSPYADVLAAVVSTLPPLTTADRRKIEQLAKDGPPEEDVGLDPFAVDPTLEPSTGGRR
jgi:nitrate reductase delta subunit